MPASKDAADLQKTKPSSPNPRPAWRTDAWFLPIALFFAGPLGLLSPWMLLKDRGCLPFQDPIWSPDNQQAMKIILILISINLAGFILSILICILRLGKGVRIFLGILATIMVLAASILYNPTVYWLTVPEVDLTSTGFVQNTMSLPSQAALTIVNDAQNETETLCVIELTVSPESCLDGYVSLANSSYVPDALVLHPGESISISFPKASIYSLYIHDGPGRFQPGNYDILIWVDDSGY